MSTGFASQFQYPGHSDFIVVVTYGSTSLFGAEQDTSKGSSKFRPLPDVPCRHFTISYNSENNRILRICRTEYLDDNGDLLTDRQMHYYNFHITQFSATQRGWEFLTLHASNLNQFAIARSGTDAAAISAFIHYDAPYTV